MKFELKPNNRDASDKDLLDDLIEASKKLNKNSFSGREYDTVGRFHSGTISRRFKGWNNAVKKAGLKITQVSSVSDEDLLEDLTRVAKLLGSKKVTQETYTEHGIYHAGTINDRFGWNNALEKAGLEISLVMRISEKELFTNLEEVWIKLGKQPGRRDMVKPYSKYSEGPYLNIYGSWRKALEAFVAKINSDSEAISEESNTTINENTVGKQEVEFKHKTKRDVSNRLKVMVLIRDGNKCKLCGVTVTGDNIHFDHIFPYCKGGETVFENLQVLCAKHNLAKGDYYDPNS